MQAYQVAYQFGLLAFQLSKKLNSQAQKCKACNGLNHLTHWVKPMREMLPTCDEGFQAGLESGEIQFAGYILMHKTYIPFSQGINLETIWTESHAFLQFCQKVNNQVAADTIQGLQLLLANLTGQTANMATFSVEGQTEAEYFLKCKSRDSSYAICRYLIAKAQVLYLYNRPADGLTCLQESVHLFDSIAGNISIIEHNFYHSLCLAALYNEFAHEGQELCLKQLHNNQQQLNIWANLCPENYLHKFLIIAAEIARISGQKETAIEHYENAIANAKAQGFIQDEAIAHERLAQLYLEFGADRSAQKYLINAYYGYARWGAITKVAALESRYPELLGAILQSSKASATVLNTLVTIANPELSRHASSRTSSNSESINQRLDFASIIKLSQALSSTIELNELLQQLTQIILQNSGGDSCVLILPDEMLNWRVRAIATPKETQLCAEVLTKNTEVPIKLIQYVKNTQEVVVIDDLATHLPVVDDYLREHQPKSVLCLPILNQGHLIGILCLENQLTSKVFTDERILLLNLLCAQAAISLENARLYQQAQHYAQQLEQSQLQVVQNEKMATLGNLVAGIAHEVNNPIGFLNGSITNAKDYVQDLFEYLEIYQSQQPPNAVVQDSAAEVDLDFLLADLPKLLDSMQAATDRIKGISTSLRTFSRADTEHPVSANVHEGLDSTLLILKYRLKAKEYRPAIEVVKNYGDLPNIYCFPGQLNQVFMNILANAIDVFDEMAQTLTFAALTTNPQRIILQTECQDNQVFIRIGDNGKGMTAEVKARVFDHLFTTKTVGKGTGLGLTIARQIVVEKHSGRLEVNSSPGQGTEFCIVLPLGGE
jgi:signal transduction histidine kinase